MNTNINDLNNQIFVKINKEKKEKASCLLKSKGKNLSTEIREMIYKLAEDYDRIKKNN